MSNKRIYLDNAATTQVDKEVMQAMLPYMVENFGNPSATYSYGREARMAVETARKTVAGLLNVHASEIIFTSGGTESNNTAILTAIRDLGCRHIITSQIEHHAVLHTVEHYGSGQDMSFSFVKLLADGHIDIYDLERQLALFEKNCFVSLMHGNNEIGNITDIKAVGDLCKAHNAFFHSDCVQTVGHYPLDIRNTPVNFISASGHKFHGPKGVGILYINSNISVNPLIWGGSQERKMRAGTENVAGIVGFAKALELAMQRYDTDREHIQSLKEYMMQQLVEHVYGVTFNGDAESKSLYSVLNVAFPQSAKTSMLLLHLDINSICASSGSACSTGSGSHVMKALYNGRSSLVVRFSFNRHNTKEEIDTVVRVIKQFYREPVKA